MGRLIVYKRPDGKFGWRLVANGHVVATDAGQGYNKRHRAREMGERVVNGDYAGATVVEY